MRDIWLGAIASLSGVIVGAIATYLTQVRLWKRTTRRELYGSFVGRSNICRDQFLEVASAIRRKLSETERAERWGKANAQMAEVSSLAAQVKMIATKKTGDAAEALEGNLSEKMRDELHGNNTKGTAPKPASEYREAYSAVLEKFIAAASKELGIARARKRIPKRSK